MGPQFFMTDYLEVELLALEQTFPGVQILHLCDFHRERAWERWTNNHKHSLSNEEKESPTGIHPKGMCKCSTNDHGSGLPHEFCYQQAVDNLEVSRIWQNQ